MSHTVRDDDHILNFPCPDAAAYYDFNFKPGYTFFQVLTNSPVAVEVSIYMEAGPEIPLCSITIGNVSDLFINPGTNVKGRIRYGQLGSNVYVIYAPNHECCK